jgi:hypothetical protein
MKYLLSAAILAGMLIGTPASAQQTFTCKFGEDGEPCRQPIDGTCQKQLARDLYVSCGALPLFDLFVCVYSNKQLSVTSAQLGANRSAVLKSVADPKYKAAAAISPAAGTLQATFGKNNASCEISK